MRAAANRALAIAALAVAATTAGGCLGTPKIEDRWTRIDLVSSTVAPFQALPSTVTLAV